MSIDDCWGAGATKPIDAIRFAMMIMYNSTTASLSIWIKWFLGEGIKWDWYTYTSTRRYQP